MATKLKNLHLTKVDVVDEGANPRADIALAKSIAGAESVPDGADGGISMQDEKDGLLKRFARWLKGEGYGYEDIEKAATSFQEQLVSRNVEKIDSEVWDITYALRQSISSIITDVELDQTAKAAGMSESIAQFTAAVTACIPKWCGGEATGVSKAIMAENEDIRRMETDREILSEMIGKAKGTEEKGDIAEMAKIDKSKMTPEELAVYEEIEKKYSIEEGGEGPDEGSVSKSSGIAPAQMEEKQDNGQEEVLKGVIADLKAEIEALKDNALTRELSAVAKKYTTLGKKEEEIVATLRKAKAAGVYDDVVSAYDTALAAQDASGIFGEIGKSREGGESGAGAIAKAREKAAEIRKSNPDLTEAQALDQVLMNDDELRKEFDQ